MGAHTTVRSDVLNKLDRALEARPSKAITALHTLAHAGLTLGSIALLLVVDEKTVRRWVAGTAPRKGDLQRLVALAARTSAAVESGAISPESTPAEMVAALAPQAP